MARRVRIEYPGAIYHVLSRGNYRKDLFTVHKSGQAFEKALFQTCRKCGWVIHAYVVMSNHYHLCVETPQGNLVNGMRWLQGTFGNRFNRFTGERGHVFQGRYKALLLEQGDWMVSLVNYIHLNPVRAGLLRVEDLPNFPLSSFPKFFKKRLPQGLERSCFLAQAGFPDSMAGMKAYHAYLESREEGEKANQEFYQKRFGRGWVIADNKQKKDLAKALLHSNEGTVRGGRKPRDIREAVWQERLELELSGRAKTNADITCDGKLADWKRQIAYQLRNETDATNPWIALALNMGHPSNVSKCAKEHPKSKD